MDPYHPANVERFNGLADLYDAHRPQPPAVIVDVLRDVAQIHSPRVVVDLGCGTGLSTRIWAGHAETVIGVEPNAEMRRLAEARSALSPGCAAIRYQDGWSTQTHLKDASVDVVTCSQCFHWMDPQPTLAEIARILRPGGALAVYDCDFPPAMCWQAYAAYKAFFDHTRALEREHGVTDSIKEWNKEHHLTRMRQSELFRFACEIHLHHAEHGNAEGLLGQAMSLGGVAALLRLGLSEEEIGLVRFNAEIRRVLGDRSVPWYFSYRMRVGLK
jgi:ubiquinone/menaquinone biosynthesis C-methylase UbiE